MDWQEMYSKGAVPTYEQVEEYINNPLWLRLNDQIKQTYGIEPKMDYSGCSMQAGWNIKYKKSGKSLCTLYPMPGYFIALVVIGSKEMHEAELIIPFCSEYVQALFADTKAGQGQKWLMIDVKAESILEDVIRLIAIRAKPKKQITE